MIKLIGNLGDVGFNGTMAAKSLLMVLTSMIRQSDQLKPKPTKRKQR